MELEPITRQEKIIAGQDLTPITRLEMFLKKFGGGGGGGGSADAVLYTPQTLTDAQKKQARTNIDAASDFVVNANAINGSEVTVDKTYAQISEAIKAGKTPSVYLLHRKIGAVYLRLYSYYENMPITFSGTGEGEKYPYMVSLVMTEDGSTDIVVDRLVEIAEDGTMRQVSMDGDPYSDMEIATKKYVDDNVCILHSTTPGSTKKFKITVDDSGAISATEVT